MSDTTDTQDTEDTADTAIPSRYQDAETIRAILREAQTIAVVGLSPNPGRPSHGVARYLQEQGYRIIPVNPNEREILGETCYPALSDIPVPVDIVDVFRRSEYVPAIAEEAVKIGAKALWLQYDVISPEGEAIAEQGGLRVVVDRCLKVEYARYGR